MTNRLTILLAALLVILSTSVVAQTSGSATGRYVTFDISQDVQELPDGTSVVLNHYHQNAFAEDDNHPIDNTSAMCVGKLNLSADGSVVSGNGSCFSSDGDGDGASFWWRMTHGGTDDCPDLCGEWGYFAGDGKFEGIEGVGTWQRTTLFSDGSSGVWDGSYTIP